MDPKIFQFHVDRLLEKRLRPSAEKWTPGAKDRLEKSYILVAKPQNTQCRYCELIVPQTNITIRFLEDTVEKKCENCRIKWVKEKKKTK